MVIPARDEALNLPPLLDSLARQSVPPTEVIVVDDGSSDKTAAVARDHGAVVLASSAPLPEGWKGKPWALQQGAEAAQGDLLLFLDADVRLKENALTELLRLSAENPRLVLSLCPWHAARTFPEELSLFFNLLMAAGAGITPRPHLASPHLLGQFLFIPKAAFFEVQGYASVRDQVLENLFLTRHLTEKGWQPQSVLGRGMAEMRMFPEGFSTLIPSWTKGFTAGANQVAAGILFASSLWFSGLFFLLFSLPLTSSPIRFLLAYFLPALALFFSSAKIGSFSRACLLWPLSLIFYQAVFFRALWRKRKGQKVLWKGRDVS